jgi:hypothetical protein
VKNEVRVPLVQKSFLRLLAWTNAMPSFLMVASEYDMYILEVRYIGY